MNVTEIEKLKKMKRSNRMERFSFYFSTIFIIFIFNITSYNTKAAWISPYSISDTIEQVTAIPEFFKVLIEDSSGSNEPDSIPANNMNNILHEPDSLLTLDSATTDTLTEDNKKWTFDASLLFRNKQVNRGVDLSGGNAISDLTIGISHQVGLSLDFDIVRRLGKDKIIQDYSFSLDYDWIITEIVDISFALKRIKYKNDSLNPVANADNSASIDLCLTFMPIFLDFFYEGSFGKDAVNYYGASVFGIFDLWKFKLFPMLSVNAISYNIQTSRLVRKSKGTFVKKTDVTSYSGISSITAILKISLPLVAGFSLSLSPNVSYCPDDKISSRKWQYLISAGIDYSLDF
ncbi:MAG: hypothetical protein HW421_3703 [Ignavibacteria bacterium]|nr:hypothetical protein [Ignavibacteria bacterium]